MILWIMMKIRTACSDCSVYRWTWVRACNTVELTFLFPLKTFYLSIENIVQYLDAHGTSKDESSVLIKVDFQSNKMLFPMFYKVCSTTLQIVYQSLGLSQWFQILMQNFKWDHPTLSLVLRTEDSKIYKWPSICDTWANLQTTNAVASNINWSGFLFSFWESLRFWSFLFLLSPIIPFLCNKIFPIGQFRAAWQDCRVLIKNRRKIKLKFKMSLIVSGT